MMPSRISPHLRAADARRVNAMSLHMDPEDIADTLGVPLAEGLAIVRRDARAARWVGRCDRTGRTVAALTEPNAAKLEVLVNINRNIASGLRDSLAREAREAAAAACTADPAATAPASTGAYAPAPGVAHTPISATA